MRLLFLTNGFPFGGEPFPELEIHYLSKFFQRIDIVPTDRIKSAALQCELPPNVFPRVDVNTKIWADFDRKVPFSFRRRMADFFPVIHNALRVKPFSLKHSLVFWDYANLIRKALGSSFQDGTPKIAYSYWAKEAAMALVLLKKVWPSVTMVSRAHAYDIYSERFGMSELPFQKQLLRGLDKIFPCSLDGEIYLRTKFPWAVNKIESAYLGALPGKNTRFSTDDTLRVLTCARLEPLKRVGKIVEVLRDCKRKIEWAVIGDGFLNEEIKRAASFLPKNISTRFLGKLPRNQVVSYYQENIVDLFLSVSLSEGIPVSMMEAMSFGVPCCATDVGGVREIVNARNGYLLHANFENSELIDILENHPANAIEMRRAAKQMQERNFNADKNYNNFAKDLLILSRA